MIEMPARALRELVAALPEANVHGDSQVLVRGIAYDSRQVMPGWLFVCIRGFKDDGHRYIPQALARGAAALVVERLEDPLPPVPVVCVSDARAALARLAARFFGEPSRRVRLIGVTGTQGKTTTVFLIEAILRAAGFNPGVLGTILARLGPTERPSKFTTPESLDLQRFLAECAGAGTAHVVMEVSSHGLALRRVEGCQFDVAVFTNLTSDHLDLHGSVGGYLRTKAQLFAAIRRGPKQFAVINQDDPNAQVIGAAARCRILTYGWRRRAHLMARGVEWGLRRVSFTAQTPAGICDVRLGLTGPHNVSNALAALGVAVGFDLNLAVACQGLASVTGIAGRFELVEVGQSFLVVVDFAHTAAAMDQLLRTARALVSGRLVVVFGCAGDRDPTKRPVIGELVARLGDYTIVTSDNPASEDPAEIARQVEEGVLRAARSRDDYAVILDREEAIGRALVLARPGDAVVLAGKGHETYQVVGDRHLPFNDSAVARRLLQG